MPQPVPHLVITPAHNEEVHLSGLIVAMVRQTVPPAEWIIVDDASTDRTAALVDAAAAEHPWIRRLVPPHATRRAVGGKVARLFLHGFSRANHGEWCFVSKIDADLSLPDDYFEQVFGRFAQDQRLGIAGGSCWERRGERLVLERVSTEHTRGALKSYRRECWEAIGGIRPVDGWDGIDNVMAQMHGWRTRSFEEIRAIHRRPTGAFRGVLRGRYTAGRFAAFMGYLPLFMLGRVLRRTLDRPLLIGGLAMGWGYLHHRLQRAARFDEPRVIAFLRQRQRERIGLARRRARG
ncbi:MAG: glycosyltransferase [Candidatus Eisenbacteria bacterium]|nr:glycosyltransferase [Candidatus Eisenbacteria bacterium]